MLHSLIINIHLLHHKITKILAILTKRTAHSPLKEEWDIYFRTRITFLIRISVQTIYRGTWFNEYMGQIKVPN